MMPEMAGDDALVAIRAFEQERGVSGTDNAVVFMVSAMDADSVVETFFKGLCTDYLAKPVQKKALLDKMREYHLLP
ncbi:MAG: hypothetical protein HQM04_19175 [Magnetococcales bacterium]|nr:hypothetical protein [Magnetococcales bacterium]MBF0117150.1 hypothetical protein [Magnetococcales bacterium]